MAQAYNDGTEATRDLLARMNQLQGILGYLDTRQTKKGESMLLEKTRKEFAKVVNQLQWSDGGLQYIVGLLDSDKMKDERQPLTFNITQVPIKIPKDVEEDKPMADKPDA